MILSCLVYRRHVKFLYLSSKINLIYTQLVYSGCEYLITHGCGFECEVNFRILGSYWSVGSTHSTPISMCLYAFRIVVITQECDNFQGRKDLSFLFYIYMYIYIYIYVYEKKLCRTSTLWVYNLNMLGSYPKF